MPPLLRIAGIAQQVLDSARILFALAARRVFVIGTNGLPDLMAAKEQFGLTLTLDDRTPISVGSGYRYADDGDGCAPAC